MTRPGPVRSTRRPARRGLRRAAALVALLLPVLLPLPAATAPAAADTTASTDSPYPATLPDFAQEGLPDWQHFDPVGGDNDRSMLVVYEYFDDLPLPPGKGEEWMARRFFGPGLPNVAGYYDAQSFGKMRFRPSGESAGTANNGVIVINSGRRADWDARSEPERNRRALLAASPFVDFSAFDRNRDRRITVDELTLVKVEVAPGDTGRELGGCGATRGVPDGTVTDGVELAGQHVALASSRTNFMTLAHEVMHAAFQMVRDVYAYGVDGYDVMGTTCYDTDYTQAVGAWIKMHLGWVRPRVVTRDGYYLVPRWDTTGVTYLLYDPAKGTEDYLMVENRRPRRGGYDHDAVDTGLNVWRFDDSQINNDGKDAFPWARVRPCEGAGCPDGWYFHAFDPTDPATPQRTAHAPWRDGSRSRVAVRAIHGAGDQQKVFFDVPGPGVLVDCFDGRTASKEIEVPAGAGDAVAVRLPAMNTGDHRDSFDFTVSGQPSSWSVAQDRGRVLDPRVPTTTNVVLRVPHGASGGTHTLAATARSRTDSSVVSGCTFKVRVTPRAVFGYAWAHAPTAASYTAPAAYSATSAGTSSTVRRLGPGQYAVTMSGIATDGGSAHVTPYGSTPRSCSVVSWVPAGTGQQVRVNCYAPSGALADAPFVTSFARPAGSPGLWGHVWASNPTAASYTPTPAYSWNSTGAPNGITRLGTGRYEVRLGRLAFDGGTAKVTRYGTGAGSCSVTGMRPAGRDQLVGVFCSGPSGAPVDQRFSLSYGQPTGLTGVLGRPLGFVHADRPSTSAYTVSGGRQHNSAGAPNRVVRTGTGRYVVEMPRIGVAAGSAQVTPYATSARCQVERWVPSGTTQRVWVLCTKATGVPVDAQFLATWTR